MVAVLIPCHNRETTIGAVVDDFHNALPDADIYVFDNASTDNTFQEAYNHNAICRREPEYGKGIVLRRMFKDIEADIFLIAEGDGSCDPAYAKALVNAVESGADIAIGARQKGISITTRIGKTFLNHYVKSLFHLKGDLDALSGYRAVKASYVKENKWKSDGFDIDMEIVIQAIRSGKKITAVPVISRPSKSRFGWCWDTAKVLGCVSSMYWLKG